ncbi:MAG: Rrf2 family transcriptional regulator [Faecalibacterium sp.]
MKFSTKSRYALRLMEQLARQKSDTCTSLKEISACQNISLKYLEQIVTPLTRAGLVKSIRGSQGGYKLTKEPRAYTAGEIIRAIEGPIATIPCLENEPNACPRCTECNTLAFWEGLDHLIHEYMESVTLEEIARNCDGADCYSI